MSPLLFIRRATARCVVAVAALVGVVAGAADVSFTGPREAGQLAAPPRNEASGLASSRRTADLLWIHDDSGGEPVLYGVATDGRLRGKLRISRVQNIDWEDIASGQIGDTPYLIIGDTGDNDGRRPYIALHFVEEPPPEKLLGSAEIVRPPAASLRVVYEDGPRDCEAVAFDASEGAVYLLSKRDDVPRLYRVALPSPLKDAEARAHFVGFVPRLPPPTGVQKLLKGHLGKHRSWPTAMDFLPDGSAAVVLTYGDVTLFPRRAGESWADALARHPVVLPAHLLLQAEAACFSRDGTQIFVASETTRALLRYDRQ